MSFLTFGLIEPINQALQKNNFLIPTPIQIKSSGKFQILYSLVFITFYS